eukprot:522793-Pyramimonas_sp.AAC.1
MLGSILGGVPDQHALELLARVGVDQVLQLATRTAGRFVEYLLELEWAEASVPHDRSHGALG